MKRLCCLLIVACLFSAPVGCGSSGPNTTVETPDTPEPAPTGGATTVKPEG